MSPFHYEDCGDTLSSTVFIHTTYAVSSGHMIRFSDHAPCKLPTRLRLVTMLPTGANVVECYEGDNGIFRYRIAGYLRGVLIFVIFVTSPGVTKFCTHENNPLYGMLRSFQCVVVGIYPISPDLCPAFIACSTHGA